MKDWPAPGLVWTLARRELRGGYKGFRVFFLCLLLGVSAIASVGAVRTAFIRGIDSESRELMGGDGGARRRSR